MGGGANLSTDTKHLAYIDALRGYAILWVIGVHATAPDMAWPLRLLAVLLTIYVVRRRGATLPEVARRLTETQ